jgi:lipid-binding SYLF domain-containing protein
MTENGLKLLSGQMTLQVEVQLGVAACPFGREAEMGVDFGHSGAAITYSYTFETGAILSIDYKNCGIDAMNKVNAVFYGGEKAAMDIIMMPGTVDITKGKGIEELHEKLTQLSKKEGDYSVCPLCTSCITCQEAGAKKSH